MSEKFRISDHVTMPIQFGLSLARLGDSAHRARLFRAIASGIRLNHILTSDSASARIQEPIDHVVDEALADNMQLLRRNQVVFPTLQGPQRAAVEAIIANRKFQHNLAIRRDGGILTVEGPDSIIQHIVAKAGNLGDESSICERCVLGNNPFYTGVPPVIDSVLEPDERAAFEAVAAQWEPGHARTGSYPKGLLQPLSRMQWVFQTWHQQFFFGNHHVRYMLYEASQRVGASRGNDSDALLMHYWRLMDGPVNGSAKVAIPDALFDMTGIGADFLMSRICGALDDVHDAIGVSPMIDRQAGVVHCQSLVTAEAVKEAIIGTAAAMMTGSSHQHRVHWPISIDDAVCIDEVDPASLSLGDIPGMDDPNYRGLLQRLGYE